VKMTVSVPDALWAKAQVLHPGVAPSALVQAALASLVGDRKPTPDQLQAFWESIE